MRQAAHTWMYIAVVLTALCGLLSSSPAAETAPVSQSETVAGTWQHRHVTFSYTGFTSLYTCSGLEGHVRQILLHLGARQDLEVSAVGCPGPQDTPSYTALVRAAFYTLAPAPDSSAGAVSG